MRRHFKEILEKLPSWILTVFTIVLILWLTLSPKPFGSMSPPLFPGSDKIAHAIMFGFLTMMICTDRCRKNGFRSLSFTFIFMAALCSFLLGVAIEFLQDALPTGRSFEAADMISDAAGAFLAALLWWMLQPNVFRNK